MPSLPALIITPAQHETGPLCTYPNVILLKVIAP